MSLNKFVDTTIKNWMNIGANEVRSNLMLASTMSATNYTGVSIIANEISSAKYTLNGSVLNNIQESEFIPVMACSSIGSSISQQNCYLSQVNQRITLNVYAIVNITTSGTNFFVDVNIPFIANDTKILVSSGNLGIASLSESIFQTNQKIHSHLISSSTITSGVYTINLVFTFTKL